MITHHRIGTDINREHLGQEQYALFEPAAAMFEALARIAVFAAQKGPPDTAGDAVVIGRTFQADLVLAGNGHAASTALPAFGRQRDIRGVYSDSLWVSWYYWYYWYYWY